MNNSAELFDTSACFALVSQDSTDGHAALAERIAKDEAERDLAARQLPLLPPAQLEPQATAAARSQFIPGTSPRHAAAACPWAVSIVATRDGFMCFESRDDARNWREAT